VFMIMFEKLEAKLNLMGSAMSSIAQDVHNIRTKVGSLEVGVQSAIVPSATYTSRHKQTHQSVNLPLCARSTDQLIYLSPPCQRLLGIPTKRKLNQQPIVPQMTVVCRQRDPRLNVQTGRRSSPLF